jgi:hypothetical protein
MRDRFNFRGIAGGGFEHYYWTALSRHVANGKLLRLEITQKYSMAYDESVYRKRYTYSSTADHSKDVIKKTPGWNQMETLK